MYFSFSEMIKWYGFYFDIHLDNLSCTNSCISITKMLNKVILRNGWNFFLNVSNYWIWSMRLKLFVCFVKVKMWLVSFTLEPLNVNSILSTNMWSINTSGEYFIFLLFTFFCEWQSLRFIDVNKCWIKNLWFFKKHKKTFFMHLNKFYLI